MMIPAPNTTPTVEKVWRQVNRLSEEVEQGKQQIWEIMQTPPILYFFRSQHHLEANARRLTRRILRRFRVVNLTNRILNAACAAAMPDFEDAIQGKSARAVRATYLVTRNIAHFSLPDVQAVTPVVE